MSESGQSGVTRRMFMPAIGGLGVALGASHGYLTNDFIESILLEKQPTVGISEALNMTLAGVVAHQSALNDGKWMDIPKYEL